MGLLSEVVVLGATSRPAVASEPPQEPAPDSGGFMDLLKDVFNLRVSIGGERPLLRQPVAERAFDDAVVFGPAVGHGIHLVVALGT